MSDAREVLEVDVLIVGGGPAGLACAKHLAGLLPEDSEAFVVLIEKAKEIGFHAISGAVMDPRGMEELVPGFLEKGCPVEAPVGDDEFLMLSESRSRKLPLVPKRMSNEGAFVCSLGKVVRWMGGLVEETGRVELFPGFAGAELLVEDGAVVGVRTGDRGIGRDGERKPNFEPGIDIRAKVTVLAEGARGNLTKVLAKDFGLAGPNPQVYALGVKELWKMPAGRVPAGRVIHTLGWPLDRETFGGGFVYGMGGDVWDVGFVTGLDYRHPYTDPHANFQRFKLHPAIRELIDGGEMIQYGAKAIPEGGLYSMLPPAVPGCLVIGDSAGTLDPLRLKGIHLAVKSGMLAAETIAAALAVGDFSTATLGRYREKLDGSFVTTELRRSRNVHAGFEKGLFRGLLNAWISLKTGGRGLRDPRPLAPGHTRIRKLAEQFGPGAAPPYAPPKYDGALTFDRLADVYRSGTKHEEDQPVHLLVHDTEICRTRCTEEFGNPCTRFCPAAVYEMEEDPERGDRRLRINAANCVHCKTCDIMDPYQIIDWVPPEGGDGPRYQDL